MAASWVATELLVDLPIIRDVGGSIAEPNEYLGGNPVEIGTGYGRCSSVCHDLRLCQWFGIGSLRYGCPVASVPGI